MAKLGYPTKTSSSKRIAVLFPHVSAISGKQIQQTVYQISVYHAIQFQTVAGWWYLSPAGYDR
jgi:hypothetical protein